MGPLAVEAVLRLLDVRRLDGAVHYSAVWFRCHRAWARGGRPAWALSDSSIDVRVEAAKALAS